MISSLFGAFGLAGATVIFEVSLSESESSTTTISGRFFGMAGSGGVGADFVSEGLEGFCTLSASTSAMLVVTGADGILSRFGPKPNDGFTVLVALELDKTFVGAMG